MSNDQIYDAIQDSLLQYSIWRPIPRYGSVKLVKGVFSYLQDSDMGLGVVQVDFVEPNPVPTELFYGNLIDPAPLFRTGLDEYDQFLRWRKTWSRVTSIQPNWMWDAGRSVLYIHNPIERYLAGVYGHAVYKRTEDLPHYGAQWVKLFALEKARYLYGEILAKYSGAVPGPVKDLALDARKRENAEKRLDAMVAELKASQELVPMTID
jgi:hypothetical protein